MIDSLLLSLCVNVYCIESLYVYDIQTIWMAIYIVWISMLYTLCKDVMKSVMKSVKSVDVYSIVPVCGCLCSKVYV